MRLTAPVVMFFQIVIIFGSNTVLRMMLNYPFHPIVAVVPGLLPPAGAAPPYKPNIMRSHNRHPLSFHMSVPP